MTYSEFLERKKTRHSATGIGHEVSVSQKLKPFQAECVRWALATGRCALFQECGLGKTWQALEWASAVSDHTHKPVLVLTPLAVAGQFVREAQKLWGQDWGKVPLHIRDMPGVHGDEHILYVTNYERLDKLRELLPRLGGIVLDESSILKAYDGKTRTDLIDSFQHVPFRLACTATPSPNDVTELGNHAEFLGAMSRVEMLATFFTHDGGDTSVWRLKGHAEQDFWAWVRSWAICASKPSDLGHGDEGYDLPPLVLHEHVVDVDASMSRRNGMLFAFEAVTLTDQRTVKRETMQERVAVAAILVNQSPGQWLVFCDLNAESEALTATIAGSIEITGSQKDDQKERAILAFIDGTIRVIVSKSSIVGFGVNLQNCHNIVFVGSDHSYERFHQAVRRCWRFGQAHTVNVHLIRTSADGRVAHNLERKRIEHEVMVRGMVDASRVAGRQRVTGGTNPMKAPSWL